MKKSSGKLISREIKNTIARYLSIMGIVALGAGFLAGLLAANPNMKSSAEHYFDTCNTFDIQIVSPLGISDEELKELSREKGISKAEGAYSMDFILENSKDEIEESRLIGKNFNEKNDFNNITLLEGRFPANNNECVIAFANPYANSYALGETLYISEKNQDYFKTGKELKESEFKVVGIAKSPIFISAQGEATNIGDGNVDLGVYVKKSVFNLELYTQANVSVSGAKKLDSFNKDYKELIKEEEEKINSFGKTKEWQVLTREDNQGITTFQEDVEKVKAISRIFPVFFFLIAALVALTTMSRLIEEERGKIGVLKALGYSNRHIIKNYFVYSLSASIIGCIVGILIGVNVLPRVISNAYSMMYNLPSLKNTFIWSNAIVVSSIILLAISIATYMALRATLREVPAALLIGKAPKIGKRILLEKITPLWKRISFTRKVTLRNLFRYKKRFLMTIVGIAGCFALLVTGFGTRDSIGDIVDNQYNKINKYDYVMGVKSQESTGSSLTLNNKEKVSSFLAFASKDITVKKQGKTKKATILSPEKTGEIENFINLKNIKGGEKIDFNNKSVVLTEKVAKDLKASVDSQILININGKDRKIKVTDIAENYVGAYIYLGKEIYEDTFVNENNYTYLLIKSNKENLEEDFLKEEGTKYIISSKTITDNFKDSIKSIDYIVIVLIICAGALAIIVLYNLTNINICERKKELGTIKVLGFYNKEVYNYIFKEVNVLAAIGIVIGIPLGILLHRFVIISAEVDAVMFGRQIYFTSYLYSVAITVIFTVLINFASRREIKRIDMVESTKANE